GLFTPLRFIDKLRAAIDVLAALDVPGIGVSMRRPRAGVLRYTLDAAAEAGTVVVNTLLGERGTLLPRPPVPASVAIDGSEPQRKLVTALGYTPVDVGPDPLPARFAFSPQERRRAEQRLLAAERAGAPALLVSDPLALARWATITRDGAWRSSRVLPVLGVGLAHLALVGRPLARASLESRPRTAPSASTASNRTAPAVTEVVS
ncbi:MAG: hypothetical protein ACOC1F_09195, partial [Myxococcota bacterium]